MAPIPSCQELDFQAQETCCSYNMLKLSKDLFCEAANSIYADHYERVLYNHIVASQHPENGRMLYMLSASARTLENVWQ